MTALDRLPEYTQYHDEGCELHPTCLDCPFPACRFDGLRGNGSGPRAFRDNEMKRLRAQGMTVPTIARRFSVSTRTVHRIMRK